MFPANKAPEMAAAIYRSMIDISPVTGIDMSEEGLIRTTMVPRGGSGSGGLQGTGKKLLQQSAQRKSAGVILSRLIMVNRFTVWLPALLFLKLHCCSER